jgi:peptide/nickel transport system substrate-binding protein
MMNEGGNLMRSGSIGARRGIIAATVALAVLATATFAATAFAQSATPNQETTFTWASVGTPSSLNPMVGYLGLDYTFWGASYNIPIEFGAKDFSPDYQHSIVTSVDVSSDNMTFTYHMRSGMKWSDGQPFTANDVAWTYGYYKKYNVSNYATDVQFIDSVTATDDTTFVLKSTQPTSFYSGGSVFLYDYILPEHIWSKYEDNYRAAKQFNNVPNVGSGPYVISEYKTGQSVTMVKNPYYWGTSVGLTPHYDKIVYLIYNNEDAIASALQNGEIDFAQFNEANIVNTLKTKPNIATRGATTPEFEELGLNTGSAYQTNPTGGFTKHGDGAHALTDPVVRQAMREAVDNKVILDKVYLGYGLVADSPVQPNATTGDWNPPPDQAFQFNIADANAKLDAAGYKMGPDGVRIDPFDGKPLEFRYYTRNSDQNTIEVAPYVKDWLGQIGIKADVASVSSAKLTTIIEDGTYEMFQWDWLPNPDPQYILGIFTCGQRVPRPGIYRNSDSYYCNPQYDKLFQAQSSAPDAAQRADIVHQMQAILYQDEPYITLVYAATLEAYRTDSVTDLTPQPADAGPVRGDLLAAYGPFSFISMRPATATAGTAAGTKGISAGVWIAIVAALVVVMLAIVLVRRRRVSDEDSA